MKARNLRIGNKIINEKGDIEEVYTLHHICGINGYDGNAGIQPYEEELFSPIPLTEEWFRKSATSTDENGDFYTAHPTITDLRFYLVDGYIQLTKIYHSPMANYKHITTVHQWQNLFFSHTEVELEFNNDL